MSQATFPFLRAAEGGSMPVARPKDAAPRGSVAVLVDAENSAWMRAGFLMRLVETAQRYGPLCVRRAYADWLHGPRALADLLTGAAFTLVQTNGPRGHRNCADIHLAAEAMELACTERGIGTFVLVTGDSDFTPLFRKLAERSLALVGCVPAGALHDCIEPLCAEMLLQPAPGEPCQYVRAPDEPAPPGEERARDLVRRAFGDAGALTVGDLHARILKLYPGFTFRSPGVGRLRTFLKGLGTVSLHKGADGKILASLVNRPPPRSSLTPAAASGGGGRAARPEEQVREEREALAAALAAGPVSLSELGERLRRSIPGFEPRRRGFRTLKRFLAAHADLVEVAPGPDGEPWARPRAAPAPTGQTGQGTRG